MDKETLLNNLESFAAKRPGFDSANYVGYWEGLRSDRRLATRQIHDVRTFLGSFDWRVIVEPCHIVEAARNTRLSIDETTGKIDYTPCQYWPTEFRAGVARVLAGAWWIAQRELMAEPTADKIREKAKALFGKGIANRYFR